MMPEPSHERALTFDCEGERLIAIINSPPNPLSTGVLVVVGGPQYRAGSHRQFVLLARELSRYRISSMRFDYRGMGDSTGSPRHFEAIEEDVRAAVDCFVAECPGVERVVIWGLCDAASAAMLYAHGDERVRGLVLLNPWVRTLAGEAKAYMRHYYLRRVADPQWWRKVISGKFRPGESMASLMDYARKALRPAGKDAAAGHGALPDRMALALSRFNGPVLLILSGNDLTAKEFEDEVRRSALWQRLLARAWVECHRIDQATHTFSSRAWRDQVATWTRDWIIALQERGGSAMASHER